MIVNSVWLTEVPIKDELADVKMRFEQQYQATFGNANGKGLYTADDWSRIAFCHQLVGDSRGSILDVGVGPGALLNMLQMSGDFIRVTGIDIRHYTKLVKLTDELDIQIMSVDDMAFADDEFDTVICMEVLEHITQDQFERALVQLRRVAGKRLFMTVPLREPLPLPSYHKLRFDFDDIERYFPNGRYYLLERRRGIPWMVITEDVSNDNSTLDGAITLAPDEE